MTSKIEQFFTHLANERIELRAANLAAFGTAITFSCVAGGTEASLAQSPNDVVTLWRVWGVMAIFLAYTLWNLFDRMRITTLRAPLTTQEWRNVRERLRWCNLALTILTTAVVVNELLARTEGSGLVRLPGSMFLANVWMVLTLVSLNSLWRQMKSRGIVQL